MRAEIKEKLNEIFNDFIPKWVKDAGKTFITISVEDWQGRNNLKITIEDVVEYYVSQAGNISSGMRTLAGHSGDWRPINELAEEVMEYFKLVNIKGLRTESERRGLEAKF